MTKSLDTQKSLSADEIRALIYGTIKLSIEPDKTTAILQRTKIEFSPDGGVIIYTSKPVQRKKAAEVPAYEDTRGQVSIGRTLNLVGAYGAYVKETPDGGYTIYTDGKIDVEHDTDPKAPVAGDIVKEKDGWIYAGKLPDGKAVYAAPRDEESPMTQRSAGKAAMSQGIDAHVPSEAELSLVFNNKAVIGGFSNDGVSSDRGLYWTSEKDSGFGKCMNFVGGSVYSEGARNKHSVRLVRN